MFNWQSTGFIGKSGREFSMIFDGKNGRDFSMIGYGEKFISQSRRDF